MTPRIATQAYLDEIKQSEDLLTQIKREAVLRRRQLEEPGRGS